MLLSILRRRTQLLLSLLAGCSHTAALTQFQGVRVVYCPHCDKRWAHSQQERSAKVGLSLAVALCVIYLQTLKISTALFLQTARCVCLKCACCTRSLSLSFSLSLSLSLSVCVCV